MVQNRQPGALLLKKPAKSPICLLRRWDSQILPATARHAQIQNHKSLDSLLNFLPLSGIMHVLRARAFLPIPIHPHPNYHHARP